MVLKEKEDKDKGEKYLGTLIRKNQETAGTY